MVTEFGWDRGELGLAVGAFLVVSAFATYLAGYLADRMSPRLLLNTGVLISALGIGLMTWSRNPGTPCSSMAWFSPSAAVWPPLRRLA
jgi:sugar phosphate permease